MDTYSLVNTTFDQAKDLVSAIEKKQYYFPIVAWMKKGYEQWELVLSKKGLNIEGSKPILRAIYDELKDNSYPFQLTDIHLVDDESQLCKSLRKLLPSVHRNQFIKQELRGLFVDGEPFPDTIVYRIQN